VEAHAEMQAAGIAMSSGRDAAHNGACYHGVSFGNVGKHGLETGDQVTGMGDSQHRPSSHAPSKGDDSSRWRTNPIRGSRVQVDAAMPSGIARRGGDESAGNGLRATEWPFPLEPRRNR
jgi:hypothetical protein